MTFKIPKKEPMSIGAFAAIPFLFALLGVGGVFYASSLLAVTSEVEHAETNRQKIKDMEKVLFGITQESKALQNQIQALERRLEEIRTQLSTLRTKKQAQVKLVHLKEESEQLRKALDKARTQLKQLETEKIRIQTRLQELKHLTQTAVDEGAQQSKQRQASQRERSKIQATVAELQKAFQTP